MASRVRVPFRRVAAEAERAGKSKDGRGWRQVGQLIDRNFAEVEQVLNAQRIVTDITTTTDATPTALGEVSIEPDATTLIESTIVGWRTDGTDQSAGYKRLGTYKITGGAVTLVGSVSAAYTAEDNAAWNATLLISGLSVYAQVTGAAGVDIVWRVVHKVTTVYEPLQS